MGQTHRSRCSLMVPLETGDGRVPNDSCAKSPNCPADLGLSPSPSSAFELSCAPQRRPCGRQSRWPLSPASAIGQRINRREIARPRMSMSGRWLTRTPPASPAEEQLEVDSPAQEVQKLAAAGVDMLEAQGQTSGRKR